MPSRAGPARSLVTFPDTVRTERRTLPLQPSTVPSYGDRHVRLIRATPRAAVIALSRTDMDILLDLLVEAQAEWEDGVQQGWVDEGDAPYWAHGAGERLSRRLAAATALMDSRPGAIGG
jgi:hypothetical protein